MSAFLPVATKWRTFWIGSFVPTATYEHLFDPLVGAGEHDRRNGEEAIAGITDDGDTL
jgi:hypothetical protein